jgi:5-methylthioadenosine/S-adenosylhomocysteine deaminase
MAQQAENSRQSDPRKVDLIVEAPWLISVVEGQAAIEDAAIAVTAGTIVAVGTRAEVNRGFQAQSKKTLPSHVLLPGLVNAHGHAAMVLFRGYAEDMSLQTWLNERIWPLESQWVDETFVRDGTRLALVEMIRSGITCFSDMYYYPEVVAEQAKQAGVRAQIAFPVIQFPNAWSTSTEDGFHKGFALHDQYRNDPHITIAFGPHSVYTITDDDLRTILTYSEELDANIQIHLHENAEEVTENQARFGVSGVCHLEQHDLLGPRLQAVHTTQLTTQEIELLATNNVHVIHCPASNAKLASGWCRTSDLLAAGVNVALGTDSAASNNTLDILGEARLASLLAKLHSSDAAALPAATALAMATINGARALGMAEQIGSLEVGKAADLIAIDVSAPEYQPLYDPLAQIIHTTAGDAVTHVWVAGQCLLEERRLNTLNLAEILPAVETWSRRIRP